MLDFAVFKNRMIRVSIVFVFISLTLFAQDSHLSWTDEPLVIFFHCDLEKDKKYLAISEIAQEQEEKSIRENGKSYFFAFPLPEKQNSIIEYKLRNGVFQVGSQIQEGIHFLNFSDPLLFVVQFVQKDYASLQNNDSNLPTFFILREKIPNSYRFLGNTNFVSCPDSPSKLGKLSLGIRDGRLIRKNLEYISLNPKWGDF
jgi:hypothetical protein